LPAPSPLSPYTTLFRSNFVPNDLHLDEHQRLLLLTGPNAAGKSTYARQAALLVLLAQIGSFLPAEAATVGVVDRIFTRVGAADLDRKSTRLNSSHEWIS